MGQLRAKVEWWVYHSSAQAGSSENRACGMAAVTVRKKKHHSLKMPDSLASSSRLPSNLSINTTLPSLMSVRPHRVSKNKQAYPPCDYFLHSPASLHSCSSEHTSLLPTRHPRTSKAHTNTRSESSNRSAVQTAPSTSHTFASTSSCARTAA